MTKKEKINQRKIVEVEWFDAQTSTESMFIDEIDKQLKPVHSKSIGYLLIDRNDYITLGFLIFGNGLIKHQQTIPKGIIKKIKVIKNGYTEIVEKKTKILNKKIGKQKSR